MLKQTVETIIDAFETTLDGHTKNEQRAQALLICQILSSIAESGVTEEESEKLWRIHWMIDKEGI